MHFCFLAITICCYANLRVSRESIAHKALIMRGRIVQSHIKRFIKEFIICHLVTNADSAIHRLSVGEPAVREKYNNTTTKKKTKTENKDRKGKNHH